MEGVRTQEYEAGAPSDQCSSPLLRRPRVLVVDDEPEICSVLREMLTSKGYDAVPVTDGRAAIEEASRGTFDLVLLDVMMPGMNGLETLRELRLRLPAALFVMITAFPDSGLVDRCLEAGAFVCLSKPVSLHEIAELLGSRLQRPGDPA